MTIAGLPRKLPICRVSDDLYIGAFVIFGDAPLTVACAAALLDKAPDYDYLITAEAKGIPLAHEMAQQHGDEHYFIARKHPKLYMSLSSVCVVTNALRLRKTRLDFTQKERTEEKQMTKLIKISGMLRLVMTPRSVLSAPRATM